MIGTMDQLITLEERVALPDGAGGTTTDWKKLDCDPCVWASVTSKAVNEGMNDGRTNATFLAIFTIYNRSDIDETNRIIWEGEAYNIRGIHRLGGRPIHMTIDAARGVAQ